MDKRKQVLESGTFGGQPLILISLTEQISKPGFKDASILNNFFSLNEEIRPKIEGKHIFIEKICFLPFYLPYSFYQAEILISSKNYYRSLVLNVKLISILAHSLITWL
jgi:hypothetical protein